MCVLVILSQYRDFTTKEEKMAKTEKTQPSFKVKKKVSGVEFLKLEIGQTIYVTITSDFTAGLMKKKQAVFMNVTDLNTGKPHKMIVPAMLHTLLNDNYANGSFVGLSFAITKGEKQRSQNGNDFSTIDLEELDV